jgi:GNAT superfamily N-acetyltransferase
MAVAVVHVRSWQAAYRNLIPQDFLDGLDGGQRSAWWERVLGATRWPELGTFVAEEAGAVIGFAHVGPARDADLDPVRVGEISSIYLLSEAWGQGFGRQLMTAALGTLSAAGFGEAALWVLDTNDRARSFYQAGGWSADGAAQQDDLGGVTLSEVRYRHPLP